MPRRPRIHFTSLRERWQASPVTGGVLGILSVAVATGIIAIMCALIAAVVTLIY